MDGTQTVYFTGPREVELRSSERPTPAGDELLIRTEYSAISSGTELLAYTGKLPARLATDVSISALEGTLEYPIAYGYSLVGRVMEIGPDVEKEWIGRRVFAFHPHASHALASADDVMPIPESCAMIDAVLFPSMETAVNFAHDGNPRAGERVVVLGQGTVGLMTTAVLAQYPLESLVTADRFERRRELSTAFGASASVDPAGGFEAVGEVLGGGDETCADLAYELSGNPEAINTAIASAGFGSRIVLGSWYGTKRAPLDLGGTFHRNRIEMISSQVSTIDPALRGRWDKPRRARVAWHLLTELQPASSVVTHRFPVERAAEAYDVLERRPEEAVQVVLRYDSRFV